MRVSRPRGHWKYSRAYLQQRTLARSVFSDDAKGLPTTDLKGDIAKSPKVPMEAPRIERSQFLQAVPRRRVNGIALGNARKFDGDRHQAQTLDKP